MLEKLQVPADGLEARGRLMYNDYGRLPHNEQSPITSDGFTRSIFEPLA